jgi:hypothetical protein
MISKGKNMYIYPLRLEEKERVKIKDITHEKNISINQLFKELLNKYFEENEDMIKNETLMDAFHKYAGIWGKKDVSYLEELRKRNRKRLSTIRK